MAAESRRICSISSPVYVASCPNVVSWPPREPSKNVRTRPIGFPAAVHFSSSERLYGALARMTRSAWTPWFS